MGFKNNQSNLTYIRVANGKFVVKAQEGATGAIPRVITSGKNEGETVWEHHHDSYTGFIKKISIKDSDNFGAQISILVADSDGSAVINIPISGRHSTKLVQTISNIDLDEEVEFLPYKFQARDRDTKKLIADKFIQGWQIKQHGEKVEDSFETGDLPELTQVKRRGKMEWDDTDRTQEVRNRLQNFIDETYASHDEEEEDDKPKKQSKPSPKPAPKKSTGDDDDDDGPIDLDEDDIPF